MNLIERAKNICLSPKTEWEVIAGETTSTSDLYKNYVVPLAAIGPIASFIGLSLVGMSMPFLGNYRVPVVAGLTSAIVQFVLGLVSLYLIALLVDALAPSFNGEKNKMQALKVVAYAFTPAWVAGVLMVLPLLGTLAILASLYGLYVLYLGLPVLMKVPQEKAVGYTIVVVICAIVLSIVAGAVTASIGGLGLAGMSRMHSSSESPDAAVALDQLKQMGERMGAAGKKMEDAQKSGDPQAQMAAATEALGTALGGDAQVTVVDQALLKALLPESLGDLKRTKSESEKSAVGGFKISKANAEYSDSADGSRNVTLSITDIGANKMLGAMFGFGFVEQDKETDNGYEKMGKIDGRPTHEEFKKDGPSGEYGVLVGGRFLVEARGRHVDMAIIREAATSVGFAKLEAMKNDGVKQ